MVLILFKDFVIHTVVFRKTTNYSILTYAYANIHAYYLGYKPGVKQSMICFRQR